MKPWKRAGPVALSLALCAGLVLPALAHTVTIDGGGSKEVKTVQAGVTAIEESLSKTGTITMDSNDDAGAVISGGNVTLDLNGNSITNNDSYGAAIAVTDGSLTLQDSGTGGTVEATDNYGVGVYVDGGTANILGGEVKATGNRSGVWVEGGTANISGGKVSGDACGVYVGKGGSATISGGSVSGNDGVYVDGGSATISGGSVNGGENGVKLIRGGTANISGGSVSGGDRGVYVRKGDLFVPGTAEISGDAIVTGKTGVEVEDSSTFTMNGGTVGSTVNGGAAVDGTGTITMTGGTIYGSVPNDVDISNVTVKDAPAPTPTPAPDPAPAPDPLTRPAAARTLLEELFRRVGGSGDLWAWAVENGLIDEDGDGEEIVTVALLRAILTRYAEVFGGNAVAVEELTTLTGEDTDVVDNCRAVLKEFFGE